jgi:hypothetical protein
MSPAAKENVDQVYKIVHAVLAGKASDIFMSRIDAIVADWSADKLTAAQACDKVQKAVGLFLGEDLAKEIQDRCAVVVMRETAGKK